MNRSNPRSRAAALSLLSALIAIVPAAARAVSRAEETHKSSTYIVQLREDAVANYRGGIPGYNATKPGKGQKIDKTHPDAASYAAYLDLRHDQVAGAARANKIQDYRYAYNGFAAEMSDAQAEALRSSPDVLAVTKDEVRDMDTSSTPTFLGLTAPGGLWDQLSGFECAGEGIVIGIIDSGIWPESASFADTSVDKGSPGDHNNCHRKFQGDLGWHGACVPGEGFSAGDCNKKLIGAKRFNAAWGGDAAVEAQRPWEFMSPRDYNGHGTHTSSTAGGNHGVQPSGPAAVFGAISGMAPRARVAMYKALWSTQDGSTASGFTSDLVAAVDQAVADGVDVINYSISGTLTNFLDPVEIAFLSAADAGVFVAASAGNSGPTSGTVAHPSPWITTVAAGTHNRNGAGSVTIGGSTFNGASVATAVGPRPLIDSTAAGLAGANATAVALCFAAADNGGVAVLDPAKVAGKIVVCDRGVNARVNKSLAVQQAGGAGMILLNISPNSLNADFHFVPTVHLADTVRLAVKGLAAAPGATATIAQATIVFDVPAPFTASFSSRGPLAAGGGDLLKPDVIAPGQDVLAAVAPPGQAGLLFNLLSGTSMSSPHVAGLAALLKDLHPDWSPMTIKSALMTTGTDILDGPNTNPLVIFRQGAGHVRPNSAADPGLAFDSELPDWLAFLCGTTTGVSASTCGALAQAGKSLDASDLNVASIAIGDMAGIQTVTRRVTNVGSERATYTASVTGMAGFNVVVSPTSLSLKPGKTAAFTVSFTRATANLNAFTGGQLTWDDGTHKVRIPIVVRPVALAAAAEVSGTGGAISYGVRFGYTGAFAATARGLVPAVTVRGTVQDDPTDSFSPGGPGTVGFPVTIPAGTTHARFSLFNENVSQPSDLDLYVFKGTTLVGSSGGGTSSEVVNLINPAAGTDYKVWVHGFAVPAGLGTTFTLFTWLVGGTAAGNMTVTAPTAATIGGAGTIDLAFSSLAPGTKYLGSVAYSGTTGLPNPTIVRVTTP